jgi:hypothetical protein
LIGVAVHPDWTTTAYNNVASCFGAAHWLGMSIFRGGTPESSATVTWLDKAELRGFKLLVSGSELTIPDSAWLADLETQVQAHPGVIMAVEGRNEPDIFWNEGGDPYTGTPRDNHMTDREVGEEWYEYAARYQTAVWDLTRSSSVPEVAALPILGSCIGHPFDTQVAADARANPTTGKCNVANAHYYPGTGTGNLTDVNEAFDLARDFAGLSSGAALWVTETGYSTTAVSDAFAAANYPGLLDFFLEDATNPATNVFCYQLVDDGLGEGWGLWSSAFVSKQMAAAVRTYTGGPSYTKFYFPSTTAGAPAVTPALDDWWTHQRSGWDRRKLSLTKMDTSFATTSTTRSASADENWVHSQFVSDALPTGLALSTDGTVISGSIRGFEGSSSHNSGVRAVVKVVSNDGNTVRAVLFDPVNESGNNNLAEFATSATGRRLAQGGYADEGLLHTGYTTVSGDRLVVEVGVHHDSSGTGTPAGTLEFGDPSATGDLPEESVTTQLVPWVGLNVSLVVDVDVSATGGVATAAGGTVTGEGEWPPPGSPQRVSRFAMTSTVRW